MGGVQLGEMRFQPIGKMGKNFCLHFLQPFLANVDWRNCNHGSREHIPIFHNPHQNSWPSPTVAARTLEYVVGVPYKATMSGREKKRFGSTSKRPANILNAVIMSTWSRRQCYEWRASRCRLPSYTKRTKGQPQGEFSPNGEVFALSRIDR